MPRIAPAEGANVHCILDDFLWPWVDSTPVLMMRGFCPQRDILQPMGAGNRRNPPGLPPRPARLRPLGSTSERISLHSRDDRDAGPGGARRLVLVEGALGWRVLWRDHRSAARRGASRLHRQPGAVQHADARPGAHQASYTLGHASASEAMRASSVGAWGGQTLGNRLDLAHASEALCDWVVREWDRTPPDVAAAMHDCFESIDVFPLLPGIAAPVVLLSGDNSPIASAQQKALAETLPNGRVELFAGYGHGVNLLQPERCSRAALEFWRSNV